MRVGDDKPCSCGPISDGQDGLFNKLVALEIEQGIVRIDGEIGSGSDYEICLAAAIRLKPKELTIIINSPGGGAYDAFALYDQIKSAGCPTIGVVQGHAASAASMIVLQACEKRLAYPHARFLVHEGRQWIMFGVQKTSDMKDDLAEMEAIQANITRILAQRSGKSEEVVKQSFERKELWMSAQQAKEWGLIDDII